MLAIDNRDRRLRSPGLHALIVGISAYPNLSTGRVEAGVIDSPTLGLRQLSSPALSAYRIASWLIERRDYLPAPLTTCRVLVLPSAGELKVEAALQDFADPCTRYRLLEEVSAWRKDASTNRQNVTFFYFAGHGVQRRRVGVDHVMLLADFGVGIGPLLENAVDTTNLLAGMAPTSGRPEIARTQLYFIDACRIRPTVFNKYEDFPVGKLWDIEAEAFDDRVVPVFHTALPGASAFALKGKQTVFSQALLECLRGGAGRELGQAPAGGPKYGVTIDSLQASLTYFLERINREKGTSAMWRMQNGGSGSDRVIHLLDTPPRVDITLELDPESARNYAEVVVEPLNRRSEADAGWHLTRVSPHPYHDQLELGLYRASASFEPSEPDYVDSSLAFAAIPPNHKVRLGVGQAPGAGGEPPAAAIG